MFNYTERQFEQQLCTPGVASSVKLSVRLQAYNAVSIVRVTTYHSEVYICICVFWLRVSQLILCVHMSVIAAHLPINLMWAHKGQCGSGLQCFFCVCDGCGLKLILDNGLIWATFRKHTSNSI